MLAVNGTGKFLLQMGGQDLSKHAKMYQKTYLNPNMDK